MKECDERKTEITYSLKNDNEVVLHVNSGGSSKEITAVVFSAEQASEIEKHNLKNNFD